MTKNKKILLATGGTGGHIFPALALKKTLDLEGFNTILTADGKFAKFHPFDQRHILIPSANFADKSILKIVKSLSSLGLGLVKSLWIMFKFKPEIVIGFGGYASYPTMLAAIIFRKKIVLHEANTVIGKVNRILLNKAQFLTTGFKIIHGVSGKYQNKVVYTGNPIRQKIILNSKKKKDKSDNFKILIIGGSQGAKIFSKIIPDAIVNLPKEVKHNLFVYQQVKEEDIASIKQRYLKEGIGCEIKSFFDDIHNKFTQVDLVIARAGASTISELIEFSLPAIYIPYPSAADNHQYHNAKELEGINAAWVVKEDVNTAANILRILKEISRNTSILTTYSKPLDNLKQNACKNIISLISSIV
jgi:UDP-N-acetylglucosamine--N-acetylmuramyl-(pentapeptide) pyrophosphoryl-undecaprenol N-acetylglucosamine transferase